MKYFYSVFFLLLISFTAYSQTGIGTATPDLSAALDITATDKGVLIPRVALSGSTDAATITKGNVNGLLVFNTRTIADVTPGFYYWFNTKWNKIIASDEIGADNGVTIVDGKVELGGTLTKPTIIKTSRANYLKLEDLIATTSLNLDNVVLTDAGGVVKTTPVTSFLGAVTTNTLTRDIINGNLVSTVNGVSSAVPMLLYAYDGVQRSPSGAVGLGGPLSHPVTITANATETLALAGLEPTTSLSTDDVVVADPVTGVLKKTPTSSLFTSGWGLSGNAGSATSFLGTTNNFPLTFKANNGTKMTITPAGNVGIGTTTPNAPLEFPAVENLRKIVLYQHTANNDFQFHGFGISTYMLRSNITNRLAGFGWFVGTSATSSSELMRLTGDGNLGIGIDTPAGKLHVAGKAIVTTMDTGADTDQIVTVDANGLLKKRPTADIGKTYTAGTGIGITGTVISASTSNALAVGATNGNLTSTVNGVASAGIPIVNGANNGVTRAANGTVELGGTLTKPTTITTTPANLLTLSGLEPATTASLNTDEVVLLSNTGVVKKSSIFDFLSARTINSVTSAGNRMMSSVNLKTGSADIINSNVIDATDGNLKSTINGITSNQIDVVTSAENGITRDKGRVLLGGPLIGRTTITASPTNTLAIGGLEVSTTPTADSPVVVGADGTLKKAAAGSSFTYNTAAVAPGGRADVTLSRNTTFGNFIIGVTNACGAYATITFTTFNNAIIYTGGQAINQYFTTSIGNLEGTLLSLTASVAGCAADGGATSQFNMSIYKNGNVLRITNNSGGNRTYIVSHTAL